MKKYASLAALLAAALAAPAMANEARVEARGGVVWVSGAEEALAGVAAGYDFDLGDSKFFAGVEASADKALVGGADVVFGVGGRIGAKVSEDGRLYATAGYSFNEGDAVHVGAGYQHNLTESVYGKVEYRRYLDNGPDLNAAVIGVGVKF